MNHKPTCKRIGKLLKAGQIQEAKMYAYQARLAGELTKQAYLFVLTYDSTGQRNTSTV